MPVTHLAPRLPRGAARLRRVLAAASLLLVLGACGGGGGGSSGNALVRVVNATRSHASVDLLADSTVVSPGVALDTASAYADVATGSASLQINDAGTSTALTTLAPSLGGNLHYTVVAYETNGRIAASVVGDDNAAPASGSATLRVLDAAPDAGAIDVYITDPAVPLAALSSPTFSFTGTASSATSSLVSFAAGTYRIRVTGQGNVNDLRLDIASVTLTSQEVGTVVLTGAVGGVLMDGGVLVQQGDYAATRNPNARVRLAAAVAGGASVGATAGADLVAAPTTSPAVGSYAVVPATSALAVTVNGVAVAGAIPALAAGSDATLLVYGDPAAPVVTVVPDDNHLPSTSSLFKVRLVDGLTGSAPTLTLTADFSAVATNVPAGTASSYGTATGSTAVRLDVTSATSLMPLYTESDLNLPADSVFTLFMLGDGAAPQHVLRRDR